MNRRAASNRLYGAIIGIGISLQGVAQTLTDPVYPNRSVPLYCHDDVQEHCIQPPKATIAPEPGYTAEAKAAKIEGTVTVQIVVDKSGKVRDVSVLRKLGHGLDEQATETVSKWEFEPATYRGQPVRCVVNLELSFRLPKENTGSRVD